MMKPKKNTSSDLDYDDEIVEEFEDEDIEDNEESEEVNGSKEEEKIVYSEKEDKPQLSIDEVIDMIQGNLSRANQLLQLLR